MEYLKLIGFLTLGAWFLRSSTDERSVQDKPEESIKGLYIAAAGASFLAAYLSGFSTYAFVAAVVIGLLNWKGIFLWRIRTSLPLVVGAFLGFFALVLGNMQEGKFYVQTLVPKDNIQPVDIPAAKLLATPWSAEDKNPNWPVALLMARLCDIAYRDPYLAEEEIEAMGFKCQTLSGSSMNGYFAVVEDSALIVLRGTENSYFDIMVDLYAVPKFTEDGKLHKGFNDAYATLHEQILGQLKRNTIKRVWITGHSLGGALAVVCAHKLLNETQYPIAGVMTFGQPMVIDKSFASVLGPKLHQKYVHFVNHYDPVPNLADPYAHFGHLVWLIGDKVYRLYGELPIVQGDASKEDQSDKPINKPLNTKEFEQAISEVKKQNPDYKPSDEPLYGGGGWISGEDHKIKNYITMMNRMLQSDFTERQEYK